VSMPSELDGAGRTRGRRWARAVVEVARIKRAEAKVGEVGDGRRGSEAIRPYEAGRGALHMQFQIRVGHVRALVSDLGYFEACGVEERASEEREWVSEGDIDAPRAFESVGTYRLETRTVDRA
jgi:hypothetical protein